MIALFEDLFIFNTLASINYDTVKKSALPRHFFVLKNLRCDDM